MAFLRFMVNGKVEKPLSLALVNNLPSIKANAIDLQTYAQKLNVGSSHEEVTNKVLWGDETGYIWFVMDLAIPMPIPIALQTKLSSIRNKLRVLKTYAVSEGINSFRGRYHICHHDSNELCEMGQEI